MIFLKGFKSKKWISYWTVYRRKHFTIDEILGNVAGQLFKYGYIVYLLAYGN